LPSPTKPGNLGFNFAEADEENMSMLHKLMLGTALGLLVPSAAQAQFSMQGRGICPWGLQIMRQQHQQQMMWQYRQQQQQAHLAMQMRQKQQYQHIQKTIQPPVRKVSSPPYVRPSTPQIVKKQVAQPLVQHRVTQEKVKHQVAQPVRQVQHQEKTVAVHLQWINRPEGPSDFCTLSRAEILALFRLHFHLVRWHTALRTVERTREHHDTKVTAIPRHANKVKKGPPEVHHPQHAKRMAPPQHQHHAKTKTVTQFHAALKVHKKTTDHTAIVNINLSTTTLEIRCARCHQRMHGNPNVPHLVGIPQAHPPLPKPLAKGPAPLPNPLAKGPVPFKNPLVKDPMPFKNPLVKDPVPFKNPLVKDPLALNKPLFKAPKQPLQLAIPQQPFAVKQPLVFAQPKPLPMAITKVQPPALSLAFPAPKPTSMVPPSVVLPTPLVKPGNLFSSTGPSVTVPQTPFAASGPTLVLPAMLANAPGKPGPYPDWTPFAPSTGTTPASGLPGDSSIDLPAGISKQPTTDRSETTEQPSSDTSGKDWLRPDFPPIPPSILLLPGRAIPRTQDPGPEFSPVRWIAEHTPPVSGNRGS
jgi:hypothetical protein